MTDSSLVLLSKLSRSFFVESEHVYIATLRRILQFMHFLELEKVDRTAQDSVSMGKFSLRLMLLISIPPVHGNTGGM